MPLVVGVSFRTAGRIHTFDPAGIELREGDYVIAETEHGLDFGQVMTELHEVPEEALDGPLHPLVRKATDADLRQQETNRAKEREAFHVAERKIEQHSLPMKLIDVEYTFDGRRITFHFSSEGRVDFRKLVRDLASHFRARIELHQVGVRDEAKMIGGIGPCGRLMCCLNYENEFYREAKRDMPRLGSTIATERGEGRVVELRVPKGTCVAALPEGGYVEVPCGGCCGRMAQTAAPSQEAPSEPEQRAPGAPDAHPADRTAPAPSAGAEERPQSNRSRPRRRRRPRRPPGAAPSAEQ